MENKINTHLFVMGIFTVILTLVFSVTTFFHGLEQQAGDYLKNTANTISKAYTHLDDYKNLSEFTEKNLRITLISPDGEILFESNAEKENMENHINRPEVEQAMKYGEGSSKRTSETLGTVDYYFALRQKDGNVLRISTGVDTMYSVFNDAIPYIALLLIGMLIISVLISLILTKKLIRPINKIATEIDTIDLSEDSVIYEELIPFINEIKSQREEIRLQLNKVKEENEKLATIIKNMSEGIVILDNNNIIMMANESAKRYLDFSDDCLQRNIVYALRDATFIDCIHNSDDKNKNTAEMKLHKRNLKIIANSVYSQNEKAGVICLILDVTSQFKADKMRQEFTANVSHELKTPLTSISGYAELIETGMAKDKDACHFAKKIHDESARMLSLVQDIIKLSELDESDLGSGFTKVDLFEIARKASDTVIPLAEKKGITIKLDGESSYVQGDSAMLTELVFNLCDNAIRYNKENGSVRVYVKDGIISVKDTGIGIPQKHLSRIFERFYRVDKSRSKQTGGTGLGLAIVKHIAEQHGALLDVESVPGEFTKITVNFTKSQK